MPDWTLRSLIQEVFSAGIEVSGGLRGRLDADTKRNLFDRIRGGEFPFYGTGGRDCIHFERSGKQTESSLPGRKSPEHRRLTFTSNIIAVIAIVTLADSGTGVSKSVWRLPPSRFPLTTIHPLSFIPPRDEKVHPSADSSNKSAIKYVVPFE